MIKNPNIPNWEYSLVQDLVWLIARSSWLAKYVINNICENYHNGYHYSYDYLVHHLVLSFLSSMSCLFDSWTLCHFVCFFCFYLMLGLLLLNLPWCSCLGEKIVLMCKYNRTITLFSFSFSFLSFISEKKKRKEKALLGFYFYSCLSFTFFHFVHK
jgi:hypothetical protein